MRAFFIIVPAILLAGCTYPNSQTEQGTPSGQLYFPQAPTGSHVLLDGQDVGLASSFDGNQTLSVAPGTHRVVVSSNGNAVIDKKYYVDAGAKVAVRND